MDQSSKNMVRCSADLAVCSDPAEVHRVQQQIVNRLHASGFGEREIFAVRLALEEALINAMKHGNQLDPAKTVHISYAIDATTIYLRICDQGAGFNPTEVPDPTETENLERPCGRGLLLIRHYMSGVQFLDEGKTILMWKTRAEQ